MCFCVDCYFAYYSIGFYKTYTKNGRYYIERVTPIDNYYSKLNILKGLNEYGR